MADPNAQDNGVVAQPATDSSPPAPPTPQPSDIEYLKSNPHVWQDFKKQFGELPDGFEKPTPTQTDIDYLNSNPGVWTQFEKAFGSLPDGWAADKPAKLADFKGDMPEVTVTAKGGPESTWGEVARAIPTAIGAGEERTLAATQEQGGAKSAAVGAVTGILGKVTGATGQDVSSPYSQARIKLWQAQVLPDALDWAAKNKAALTDDPLVKQAAQHVGLRPDQFTKDWQDYAGKKPEELQAMRDQQREAMANAQASTQEGKRRRELAGEVERQYAPNVSDSALKSAAFTIGTQGPELAGAVALSVLAPVTAIPATALLTTDMGQRAYSSGKDAGLSDQDAKAYGLLTAATMFAPGVKVADALSKAPGASKILQSITGKMFAAGTAAKVAGGALDTTAAFTLMNALQAGVDKGFIDPDMTLSDALHSIAGDIKGNALTGAAMSAFHVGAHRVMHGPEPKTPQQLEDSMREQPGAVPHADDEAILQKIVDQQPISPEESQQLAGKGLITVGKQTGKPMILPAGKRFMEAAKTARETQQDTAKTNAEVESQPKVTEAEDTEAAGKAPRTPDEPEDKAAADARRAGNHNNALQPEQAEKQRQINVAFADRDAAAEKQKADDYLKAQNQRADEIIANAEHTVTENPGKMTIADALATARKAPDDVKAQIPRNPELTPEERNIESKFIDQIGSNVNKAIDDYSKIPATDGGRMISTDEVRMLSPDHQKDPSMATAIHEPSSWLANVMFRRALAEPPGPNQDNHVIFTSGGSGSAKSSSLFGNEYENNSLTKRAQIIYDTAMESPANAMSKVEAARQAGKFVSVAFVYRDPIESWRDGVLPRAMENGRIVTADAHRRTHAGAPEAIRQILEKYKDDPKVSVVAIDNSNGDGRAQLMDPEEALKLPSKVTVGRLNSEALEALRANEISDHVYERATGLTAPTKGVDGESAKDTEGKLPRDRNAKPAESEHPSAEVGKPAERGPAVDKLARLEQRARRRLSAERERAGAQRIGGGKAGPYTQVADSLKAGDNKGLRAFLGQPMTNIRDNVRALNSAHTMLDTLAEHARDPRVLDLIKALRIHMPDVAVGFVRNVTNDEGKELPLAIGRYRSGAVQIKMAVGSGGTAQMVLTALHEFVHAATYSAIEGDPNGPLASKMKSLLNEARALAAQQYGKELVDAHIDYFSGKTKIQPEGYNRNLYVLTNVHELMAETLASHSAQKFLSELSAGPRLNTLPSTEPKGLFGKMIDNIAKFLGLKPDTKSLLADIIATTGKVMQVQPSMGFNKANLLRIDEGKPGKKDQQTRDIIDDVEAGRNSKLVQAAVELGALKIVRGIVRFPEWRGAMQEELGAGIKAVAQRLYDMAKDKTVDIKSLVYKTRGKEFVGGPPGIGRDDLAPLRAQLRRLAREGESAKDWYKESSEAILDAVNGDREDAKKLAGLMSIFSARTTLAGNTTMALRAWYQWKAGEAIKVATTDKNELAQRWLDTGVEPTGMKRSNFYGNLLQELEGGEKGSVYDNGVTVDVWMMRALGYKRDAPTLAQYAFVSDQIRQVAKQLKWTPTQVQAAVWVSTKTRWEQVRSDVNKEGLRKGWLEQKTTKAGPVLEVVDPERYYGRMFDKAMAATLDPEHLQRSAANFRTELLKHRAQVSWEAMPGSSSARLRGIDMLPVEHLENFQRDVSQAHVNPKTGNDQLMEALGILSMRHVDGNSAWFTDHGQVMRFRHWSVKDDLAQLDPKFMGTSGVGMTVEERNRTNKVTALYPYALEPGQPERLVSATAPHQYVVEIPAAHLYDSARDPRGFKQAAMEPIAMDSEGDPTEFAYNHDTFEQQVKDAGYTGYYVNDPGTELHGQARVFKPVAATPVADYANTEPSGVLPYAKAGAQEIIYAPLAKGAAQEPGAPLDPQAKALMQSYAAAVGKLNNQDSVGWHRPRFGRIAGAFQNGIELRIPDATREDYMRVYKQMTDELKREGLTDKQAAEFAPIQTDTGVRFVNWGALDNTAFQRAAERAFGTEDLFGKKYDRTPFAADGGLIANDWKQHPNGEAYDSIIAGNGHAARVRDAVADIGRRLEEVYRDYAQRFRLDDATTESSARAQHPTKASDPVSVDQLKTGAGLHENVLRRFGALRAGDTLEELKLYDLKRLTDNPKDAPEFAKKLGFDVEYFSFESDPSKGVEFRLPRLGKHGYEDGKLWLYDPRVGAGSFYDAEYTRAWRVTHELGHAITEPLLQARYGDSRRYGRLGQELEVTRGVLGKQRQVTERPLTLKEAQRAVEWEDAAFRAQREVLKGLGVTISDADFAREYNVNLSDAVYRVLSGNFGDPALSGFVPNDKTQPLKDVLGLLAEAEGKLAKVQGREPTPGIDLAAYNTFTDAEIRQLVENRASGVKDVKFSARPDEAMDYRVVVKDGQGNEIDGPHQDLLFSNEQDASDHITRMADEHAGPLASNTVDHNHYWSQVTKNGKVDRTFALEPVSRNPFRGQAPRGGEGTPAKRFIGEFEKQYPESGEIGERLVNGNTVVSIQSDPINQGTAYVSYVRALTPGHGDGTKALHDVVGMADKHGIALELNAVPIDPNGLPSRALIDWYKKLGFREVGQPGETAWGQTSQLMRREPAEKPEQIPPFATNAGKGISAQDAAEVMKRAKEMFPQAIHHLATSIEDTPHEVQAIAAVRGLTDRVQAAYVREYDGTHVYMIQNNMRSVDEALRTMVEENVGHDGIAKTFGPAVGNLMDGFLRNEALRPAIIEMAAREGINLRAANTPLLRKEALRAAAEEWLAHGAAREIAGQRAPQGLQKAVRDVVAAVKVWAASKGLGVTLGHAEALHALAKAHRYVTSGDWMTRISEQREADSAAKVKFAAAPPSGNADLDELLNDKIGAPKTGWRTRLTAATQDIRSRRYIEALDRMYRVKQYEDDLKVPAAEAGYKSMRLSTNVAPLLRNLMEFGHLDWEPTPGADPDKSMAPVWKAGKPFNEIVAPLGNDPRMTRMFEGYLIALRAQDLINRGRGDAVAKLLEPRHIKAGLDLGAQYPHFVTMQKELAAINKNMLDFAERGGALDPEVRKLFESDAYTPWFRATDEAGGGPWSAGSLARVRNPIMRLRGSEKSINDPLGNIVRNWSTLINASIKAHAVRVAVDNLSQAGVAVRVPALERGRDALVPTSEVQKLLLKHGIINTSMSPDAIGGIQKLMSLSAPQGDDIVQVWRGGKREYYRLEDPSLAVAFAAMKGSPLKTFEDNATGKALVAAFRIPKQVFTHLTTHLPLFGIRTLYKDNINAWTVGRGYMPVTPVVSAISGLVKTMRGSESFKRMAAAGATFNAGRADPYDTNMSVKRYMRSPNLVGRLWGFYRDFVTAGENASRVTIYERTLKETGSHKIAAYEARDLMDYARRGSSPIIHFLVETVPFWGAHVQGIDRTARAFVPSNSRTYGQIAAGAAKRMVPILLKGALLSTLSMGLYMHNRNNPAYQELTDLDKELYYHIYVGGYHIKIPKAFESGTVFGTVPELVADAAMSDDPQVATEDAQSLLHAFGAGLNLYPRVTALTPLWELYTNHNTSTGAPILSDFDQKLLPSEQVGPTTSAAVTALARGMPGMAPEAMQSPKRMQHLIQGYLGLAGSYGLAAADYMYRKAFDLPAAPERNMQQIPLVGQVVTRTDQPPTQTRSLTELSNIMIEANRVQDTIHELQKKEDQESLDRADKLQQENEELLNAGDQMRPLYEDIKKLNAAKRQIQGDPSMTGKEKQDALNDIQKDIDEEAREAYQYRPGTKLSKELLQNTTSAVSPADKARILRRADQPALASIVTQYAKGVPTSVQAAIEELA